MEQSEDPSNRTGMVYSNPTTIHTITINIIPLTTHHTTTTTTTAILTYQVQEEVVQEEVEEQVLM